MRLLLGWETPDDWLLWLWRRLRIKEGWLSLFLLTCVLMSTVWSVEAAGWVSKLPPLGWIALAAMTFGFIFAKMHFSGFLLHPLAFVYGFGVVVWQTMTVINLPTWEARFVDLVLRLNAWGYAARTGGINNDSLVFVFTLVCLAWILAYFSAWFVFRSHHIWWAIIPSGVAILMNLRYAQPHVAIWFAIYLFSAMLLFVRMSFFLKEKDWDESQVSYSRQMSLTYFPTAILICTGILIAAWLTPTGAASVIAADVWRNASGPYQEFQIEFNRLFASLTSSTEESGNAFGRTMVLRGPVSLSSRIAMLVSAEEPHYWRAISYDTYVGRGWVNGDRSERPTRSFTSLAYGKQYQERREITQTVNLQQPKNDLIMSAGQPLKVGLPIMAETIRVPSFVIDLTDRSADRYLPPEIRRYSERIRRSVERAQADGTLGESPWPTGFITDLPSDVEVARLVGKDSATVTGVELTRASPYPIDIIAVRAFQHLKKGQEYSVVSSVSIATEKQLRSAGIYYPSWITDRYLQISPNFPNRVAELAESVAKEATSPYDKAVAIQNYLRTIKYNQNIDAPPSTVDPVEYFLFMSQEGYCDYYASAMVMMLRTLGIPARIATGYLPGTYDEKNRVYVVRESNAHAWPEVFFPMYGWIEFEPTASVDPIYRPSEEQLAELDMPTSFGGTDEGEIPEDILPEDLFLEMDGAADSETGALPIAAGGGSLIVVAALGLLLWLMWQRGFTTLALPSQVYEKMCQLATLARLGPKPAQTPYEYADYLSYAIPEHAADVRRIAEAYTDMRFGGKRPAEGEAARLERSWHRLRKRLLHLVVARR